jgi:ABC-2 type transport system ATP-binding protein
MNIIEILHLTRDFGNHKGVFDISINIKEGEVYGFLGPNGAGKSTTMRHLMGFYKCQKGFCKIFNMDCWAEQKEIQKTLGYLPGEIAFPNDMTAKHYINMIAKMQGIQDMNYEEELEKYFEIEKDTNINLKKMSKGMKQKIGIIIAFMNKPKLLLLDEPTSGLDPVMQNKFWDLIKDYKNNGATIFMSSHIFEEVEKTCDRVGIIKNGNLIKEVEISEFKHSKSKTYNIGFKSLEEIEEVNKIFENYEVDLENKTITIDVNDSDINKLINVLSKCDIKSFEEEKHSLENYFMKFYGDCNND